MERRHRACGVDAAVAAGGQGRVLMARSQEGDHGQGGAIVAVVVVMMKGSGQMLVGMESRREASGRWRGGSYRRRWWWWSWWWDKACRGTGGGPYIY